MSKAGDDTRRPCKRCRKLTLQVRDVGPGYAGWICSRCMQFDRDVYRAGLVSAGGLAVLAVLLALAVKAILTVVPAP